MLGARDVRSRGETGLVIGRIGCKWLDSVSLDFGYDTCRFYDLDGYLITYTPPAIVDRGSSEGPIELIRL